MMQYLKNEGNSEGIELHLQTSVYPKDAVIKACHVFSRDNHCEIKESADGFLAITIRPRRKNKIDKNEEDLATKFLNEVLNQIIRIKLAKETAEIRKLIVAKAFFGAISPQKEV